MRSILPLLFTITLAAASGSISPAEGQAMMIADARRLPLVEVVTVEGYVSVASGIIAAGFAMRDHSGGIYVDADSSTRLPESQRLRVTGRLTTSHGLLRIAPTAVEVLPREGEANHLVFQTATGAVGEATEGRMIWMEATMVGEVVDDRPYGWKMTIDDGTGPLLAFIPAAAKIDVSRFRAGQRLRVHGFSAQYDDHYEIIPRPERDVELIAGPR